MVARRRVLKVMKDSMVLECTVSLVSGERAGYYYGTTLTLVVYCFAVFVL